MGAHILAVFEFPRGSRGVKTKIGMPKNLELKT